MTEFSTSRAAAAAAAPTDPIGSAAATAAPAALSVFASVLQDSPKNPPNDQPSTSDASHKSNVQTISAEIENLSIQEQTEEQQTDLKEQKKSHKYHTRLSPKDPLS